MFGYSCKENEFFVLPKLSQAIIKAKVELDTQFLRVNSLTHEQLKQIEKAQGRFLPLYLKWRYGSPQTYVLLAYVGKILVHIEWIVPAQKMKIRYPFVSDKAYSIISCFTEPAFRGLGIFPSQIQKVMASFMPAEKFCIWAASTNMPSLKAIKKAGGKKVGKFIQKKWLWGFCSKIRFSEEV